MQKLSNLKVCAYCKKERPEDLFFKTKNKPVCYKCNPHYRTGKVLNRVTRTWVGYRKPIDKKIQRLKWLEYYQQNRDELREKAKIKYRLSKGLPIV